MFGNENKISFKQKICQINKYNAMLLFMVIRQPTVIKKTKEKKKKKKKRENGQNTK